MWHMDVTLRSPAAPTDTSTPRALTVISRTVDREAEALDLGEVAWGLRQGTVNPGISC